MDATSARKAMMASMSEERVEEILDMHGLEKLMETITDRSEFVAELAVVREHSVAFNRTERI